MLKKSFLPILLIVLVSACSNPIRDTAQKQKEEPLHDSIPNSLTLGFILAEPPVITVNLHILTKDDLYGFWVGMFVPDPGDKEIAEDDYISIGDDRAWNRSNKISLSIDSIADDSSIFGHSVVAGNFRPFKGKYRYASERFEFEVKEPGDDKYDGAFSFSIAMNADKISGVWKSYKKLEIPKRQYELSKKLFVYNPANKLEDVYVDWEKSRKTKSDPEIDDDYEKAYFSTTGIIHKFNPSLVLLKSKDVEKFTKADLYVLRNSIYAKHGYSFKKRALRAFFDAHDWYMPVNVEIKKELTEIEKANIKLLLRYEKNAEEYYDEFGRG